MKYNYIIITFVFIVLIQSCQQDNEAIIWNDITPFHGYWRDTLVDNGNTFIEDLIVHNNLFEYVLTNSNTHIVFDKLTGNITLGIENKMVWDGICPLTNSSHPYYWKVIDLTPYKMSLYSNLIGERKFKRVYTSSINEHAINDTLSEISQYLNYLPLSSKELVTVFGTYNNLTSHDNPTYLLNHPIFERISFNAISYNDSIYAYTLKTHEGCYSLINKVISSCLTCFRSLANTREYCNADSIEKASIIISINKKNDQITVSSLRGYDYWPDVTHFLGKNIQEVKAELGSKYVYIYHSYQENGLSELSYQTSKDSLCSSISMIVDSKDMVQSCSVRLLKQYMQRKKNDAIKEEEKIAFLLKKKYVFKNEETDENGNKVYYFYPYATISDSKFEIVLRLDNYQNDISNLFCVTIDYKTF